MNSVKLEEVTYAVKAYQKLKKTFIDFASICEEVLSKDNKFKVEYLSFNHGIISIRVFDKLVEISMSMVFPDGPPVLGIIIFDHVLNEKNRNNLMSIFFDHLGNTRNSVNGHCNMYILTDRNCLDPILIKLLDCYINKYFYSNSLISSPKE